MEIEKKITVAELNGETFKTSILEASEYRNSAFTHYLLNHNNGVSGFYKKGAITHFQQALRYKYSRE